MKFERGKIDEKSAVPIPGTDRHLCTCTRCGGIWVSFGNLPGTCAKCRSPYWRLLRCNNVKSKDLKVKDSF